MSELSANSKTPAIRFDGFSGEWVEVKLERIFNQIRNAFVGTATPYYVESGNFYLESNNVKDGKINRKSEIFINDEFYKKQSDKWLKTGDIVMVQSGHVGHTAVIPSELNNIAAHALIMFTEPKEKIAPHFFNSHFQTIKVKNKLAEITTGNTIKHILSSEMKEFEVTLPSNQEQTQIGNFFQQLDRLIAQHQQKHDKLQCVKKALLEKMFPKQGETQPAIRFKGFSEAWEEKALGEVADFNPKSNLPEFFEYVDLESVVGTQMESHRTESKATAPSRAQRVACKGDIFYQTVRPYQKNNYLFEKSSENYVFSTGYAQMRPKGNGYFLLSLVQNEEFVKLVLDNCTGTSYPAINSTDLSKLEVTCPEIKEQTKISTLFQQLDSLIKQQQSQLTKLGNIKQAMLAKMFV